MAFAEHPLRRWAVNEMHLRRFAPVAVGSEIYQVVRLVEQAERGLEDSYLIGDKPDFDEWGLAPRYGSARTHGGIYFIWERHTEASTITLIFPTEADDAARGSYIRWLEQWPGGVVRATRVFVIAQTADAPERVAALGLSASDMVCCDVNGDIRIWSFGIHDDGYGRLLMTAGAVSDSERGRIVQRLQELGNYRNLTLLGLPTVQESGPTADMLEIKLSDHARRAARADEDDDMLLDQLADLSSELELIRSATSFRLSATAAYAEVAADRLASLQVRNVANCQSLTEFTERRLIPASRTCSVFRQRLSDIAERISGVMHTLDVRIDSRIKGQNLQLMRSMERSTQLQLRLQTLVEGLSVIAAAYYIMGLFAFVAKGVAAYPAGSNTDLFVGAATLPIILLIYLFVRHLRHKVLKEAEGENARITDH